MSTLLRPPRVRLSWVPTELDLYFQAYRVYRRPARTPALPWQLIAELVVPTGYDRGDVEAQHVTFDDYQAGWSVTGGEWETGHDYVVRSVDIAGAESPVTPSDVTARGVVVPYPGNPWITCNTLPPLSCPVEILQGESNTVDPRVIVRQYAGRDRFVTITPAESPGRSLSGSSQFFAPTGAYQLNPLRLVSKSGLEVALLKRLGERVVGTVHVTGFAPVTSAREAVGFSMYETDDSSVADYNLPAGLVLNGTDEYITTPDADHLDPGSSPFSVVMAAQFAGAGGTDWALSKGNIGTTAGYSIGTTGAANTLEFKVSGASAFGSATEASASWFDGVRVAVGTSNGSLLSLYRDGTLVDTTAVTHGAVTNSVALLAGANNGASPASFMALNPLQSYAVYMRELTATEARDASYYLLGYPGYRMPAGAVLFVDLRDDRCWKGTGSTISDLSDYGNTVTAVGSPVTRGIPWPLARYETP